MFRNISEAGMSLGCQIPNIIRSRSQVNKGINKQDAKYTIHNSTEVNNNKPII